MTREATKGAVARQRLFERRLFVGRRGSTLPYRLLRPEDAPPGRKFPLVVFLHGAGERGADNTAPLKWCVADFAKPDVRRKFPGFVVAPQCPKGSQWVDVPWEGNQSPPTPAEPTAPMRSLIALIDELGRSLPIDQDRLYVGGLSMGGYGTWDLIARRPNQFAAAFPICGGGDPSSAPPLAHLPIWVFHGLKDEIVPPARSQAMIDALAAAGAARVRVSLYPGVGHHSWLNAFAEPEFFDWLAAQRRP